MPRMKIELKGRKVGVEEEAAVEGRKVGAPVQIVNEQGLVVAEGYLEVDVVVTDSETFDLPVRFVGNKIR